MTKLFYQVIIEDRVIDLRTDFEVLDNLTRSINDQLMLLKVAHACMDKNEARKKTGMDIIEKVIYIEYLND